MRSIVRLGLAASALAIGACRTEPDRETGAPGSSTASVAMESVMAESAFVPPTRRAPRRPEPAPRDADQRFLRAMIDVHEGMIVMAHAAMMRHDLHHGTDESVLEVDSFEDSEKQRVMALLKAKYGDGHEPWASDADHALADSLARLPADAFTEAFRGGVRAHHRQAIALIDRSLPALRDPDTRALARAMRARHARQLTRLAESTAGPADH